MIKIKGNNNYLKNLANTVHDVKLPLTIIYTEIERLENLDDLSEDGKKYVKSIRKNWFRVLKLLNDLEDREKLSQNRLEVKYYDLDIIFLLKELIDNVNSLSKKKNIEIKLDTDLNKKIIAVDKEFIERIILNLLSNSIKHIEENKKIIISVFEKDNNLEIAIKDNGSGINENIIKNIFSEKMNNENNIHYNSGLGLSIVKEFTELLNGKINILSSINGTEVKITLPIFLTNENYQEGNLENFYMNNIIEIEMS